MAKLMLIGAVAAGAAGVGCLLCWSRRGRRSALDPDGKLKLDLPLKDVTVLNHNSRVLRFELPEAGQVLGLPVGKHVSLRCKINGRLVARAYTPISNDDTHVGFLDLAVKVYPNGKMTQHLEHMKVGDTITVAGPKGEFEYLGCGKVKLTKKGYPSSLAVKSLSMLAGGSGITPILQVIEAIERDPKDTTEVFMIYANQTEEDILLRDRLDQLAAARPKQFNFWFTLDRPSASWKQGVGFITESMMRTHLGPTQESMALMCGPPLMLEKACHPNLDALGFTKLQKFEF